MRFSLTILGSNSAIPARNRHPSAQVLQVYENPYLIDCGEGTQMQFPLYGVRYQRIEHVFISHLHGDHYYGLIGLISTYNLTGRAKALHIYGHAPLEEIIHMQLRASATDLHFPLHFHVIREDQDGIIHQDDRVEVFCFPLDHRIPTQGFLFREKAGLRSVVKDRVQGLQIPNDAYQAIKRGADFVMPDGRVILNHTITRAAPESRSYAYVSDTRLIPDLVKTLRGVDLLYHEATFLHDKVEVARNKYHSTAAEAAWMAREAGVAKLIIGHFSTRYKNLDSFLTEAREVFPNTELGLEGSVFQVNVE